MSVAAVRPAVDRYLAVLRRPAVAFALGASVVGRLHESMIAFGVILVVTAGGSYADAGWVLAAYGAGGIVAAPAAARLADRLGHRPVLAVTAVGHAVAVLALARGTVPCCRSRWSPACSPRRSRPPCARRCRGWWATSCA